MANNKKMTPMIKTTVALLINIVVFIILRYCTLIGLFLAGYGSSGKKMINDELIALIVFALQMVTFYIFIRKWKNKQLTFLVVFLTLIVIYIFDYLGFIPFLRS
jgi:hypothetical protein